MSQELVYHLGVESLRAKRSNLFFRQRLLRRLQFLAMTFTSAVQIAPKVRIFLVTLVMSMLASLASAQSLENYQPVTSERLLHPEPQNWLMYRGTYDSWGYSALKQINTKNVRKLVPAWTFSTGVGEGHQSPPIVNNGIMFITTPQNQVLALDAKAGDLLWRYKRELPEDLFQLHPTNRGVALYGDNVYLATVDAHLIALNARTGEVVWDQTVENYLTGYYMTLAPLVVRGKVMVGVSGGELGIRGFVQAFDAETGKPVWKTYTVPGPGEPGNDTWPGETWKNGAVPIWITGSYDPQLNLTYWGTGNPGPFMGEVRKGDNLYANSVIALDADTGKLKAYHQYHWNDSWDWDEVSAPICSMCTETDARSKRSCILPATATYGCLNAAPTKSPTFMLNRLSNKMCSRS